MERLTNSLAGLLSPSKEQRVQTQGLEAGSDVEDAEGESERAWRSGACAPFL